MRLFVVVAVACCGCAVQQDEVPTSRPVEIDALSQDVATASDSSEPMDTTTSLDTRPTTDSADTMPSPDTTPPPDTDVADTAVADTEPPPKSSEQLRCESGAPRLQWSGTSCEDSVAPTVGTKQPCGFRVASDKRLRCLPTRSYTTSDKGGTYGSGCVGGLFNTLLKSTSHAPPYNPVTYTDAAGTLFAVTTQFRGTPGPGGWVDNFCAKTTTFYPYGNASGFSLVLGDMIPASSYVEAL